jgi:hypothetical protein
MHLVPNPTAFGEFQIPFFCLFLLLFLMHW